MAANKKRPRRDAGSGGLWAKHRCGKKLGEDTWPCGKDAPAKCPQAMWVGTLDLGIGGDGKRRQRYVYARNRNECAAKLREARKAHDDGQVTTSNKTTVEAWLLHWIDEIMKPQLKPRSYVTNAGTVRANIVPHVGAHKLANLKPEHVREMHKRILADGKSTRTAHNAHTILSTALTAAMREGLITRNVASLVAKPKVLAADRGALTVEQARQLLMHSARTDDPMTTRWAAALLLGARQGECLGLTWDRVDLDRGLADISWQLQQLPQVHGCGDPGSNGYPCGRKVPRNCTNPLIDADPGFKYQRVRGALCLTAPKSERSTRVVPLPEPLLTGLRQRYAEHGPGLYGLVWTDHRGEPIGPKVDREAWHAALAAAGLPQVHLHEARHTTATLLAQLGVEEHVRMQIMGHSSYVAARGYTHVDQSLTGAALGRLSELLAVDGTDMPTGLHVVA